MKYDCFQDKVAIITGGTRGIGRQVAEQLAKQGCNLALVFKRDKRSADAAAEELMRHNINVQLIQANLAHDHAPDTIANEFQTKFGRLDYLVSNAAFGIMRPVGEFTGKRFDAAMAPNAKAYLLLTQELSPIMVPPGDEGKYRDENGGIKAEKRIVALSSLGSIRAIPGYVGVGASKAAMESITRYLAYELAPRGIAVNNVSGGLVDTDALRAFGESTDWMDREIKETPLRRIAYPNDIAKVVLFLLSDQAAWITGQTIVADGGLTLT
ncbi:MAG TPA: SDR family oxidoreductase [bacterium]|jgi:enoyl-[acyl-carrier protein] reductase III